MYYTIVLVLYVIIFDCLVATIKLDTIGHISCDILFAFKYFISFVLSCKSIKDMIGAAIYSTEARNA